MTQRSPRGVPPGWERLSPPGNKLRAYWRHKSGFVVQHCGHPTANWPYYIVDPEHPTRCLMTHNGLGFRTLAVAREAVEALVAGQIRATNERCGPSTRRLENVFYGSVER